MPSFADRVKETTISTGTTAVTLAGAAAGFQSFTSAFPDQATVYYCITDGTAWEVGRGTFTLAGTTLSRDEVFASSNGNALVNFAAGSKDVFSSAVASVAQVKTPNQIPQQTASTFIDDTEDVLFVRDLKVNNNVLLGPSSTLYGVV